MFNGLLFAAYSDAAIDRGLISFADNGLVLIKPDLSWEALALLGPDLVMPLPLDAGHRVQFAWHRKR